MKERVGFGPRLGAAVIDALIVIVVSVIAMMIFGALFGTGGATAAVAIFGVFYGLIEGTTGASPGKRILGLKIGTAEGTLAEKNTLLTRYAVKYSGSLLGLLAAITGIGLVSILGNIAGLIIFIGCFFVLAANRQAFHDMAAKTAVYRKEQLGATVNA